MIIRQTKKLEINNKDVYIRVNDFKTSFWEEDLEFVKEFDFLGLFVPLVETSEELKKLKKYSLSNRKIVPIIETVKGFNNINSILSTDVNIERVGFGVFDYCLDLNIPFDSNNPLITHSKIELVLAARANGLGAPIDSVYPNYKDEEGLVEELKKAKQLGIKSKLCIHPNQLDVVNEFFAIDEKEYKWAVKTKTLFEEAESKGIAAISVDDEMIDYPIYKLALQVIEKHDKKLIK